MSEAMLDTEKQSLDTRELEELDLAFSRADSIVTKNYLSILENSKLVETDSDFDKIAIYERASLFRIKKIVYDRDENNLQKLVNTYAATIGFDSSIVMVINSDGKEVELYMGTTGADEVSSARAASNALCNNLVGNFPGSLGNFDEIVLDNSQLETLLENCTKDLYGSVSVVSGVGSNRSESDVANESYVQGIEKMIDTMQGIPFSAVFIANKIDRAQLEDIKAEYELLYSRLIPFLKSELSFNESSSEGVSKTMTESLSTTLTKSRSSALSVGTNESKSHTKGNAVTHADTVSASATFDVGLAKATVGYSHSVARTKSWADTTTFGTTKSQTSTIGDSEAKGEIKSIADGSNKTETTGRSLSITYLNKTVQQLLDKIDEQLERIKYSENYGVFATASYFFASTPMEARMIASSYKGLINGNGTHIENAHINSWHDEYSLQVIKKYILKLCHPVFELDTVNQVSPASIVSGNELAIQMGLPHSSIPGVSVIETASFGRNIMVERNKGRRYIEVGNLYHMGKDEEGAKGKIPVKLDLDSLAMHTFITGSTGAGKSNAVYSILERVLDQGNELRKVTFMVVEPAKGEYKDKYGHRKDVHVYGTNSRKTDLLRINPFSFPSDIHVLEHIDRLIEIFNVCWPMYAAMPAVLKEAVERAYISAGWDLNESECQYRSLDGDTLYPTFGDVLKQITLVIEESQYSTDSKGDYKGALCTRIRSMTNGLYGQIFTPDELSLQELYDENVIVDLSRIGSIETKALIMGLLVIKMQEYRMTSQHENNAGLRHLTVLEEAHNLLKKTSSDQSMDSANLLGKSVEMLSNSIAEMRTYGEGFIIADQAPGLLDMSVIRNTNTKIILRLPDMSDRELVGRAASLNDNQILELSKLQTGVAAIYQNNWIEPVLCHIHPCKDDEKKYEYIAPTDKFVDDVKALIDYIMLPAPKKLEVDTNKLEELEKTIYKCQITSETKVHILRYIKENDVEKIHKMRYKIIYGIFNSEIALMLSSTDKKNIDLWYNTMIEKLEPNLASFGAIEQDKILAIIASEQAERDCTDNSIQLYDDLMQYIDKKNKGGYI